MIVECVRVLWWRQVMLAGCRACEGSGAIGPCDGVSDSTKKSHVRDVRMTLYVRTEYVRDVRIMWNSDGMDVLVSVFFFLSSHVAIRRHGRKGVFFVVGGSGRASGYCHAQRR